MPTDEDVMAKALAAIRGTIEKTAFQLAALPKGLRAQRLVFVRQAHEDTLRENGYDPTIDPGKTLVDQIMAGTEHLLADLDNTENQKKN
jgi:hypothetical protein